MMVIGGFAPTTEATRRGLRPPLLIIFVCIIDIECLNLWFKFLLNIFFFGWPPSPRIIFLRVALPTTPLKNKKSGWATDETGRA